MDKKSGYIRFSGTFCNHLREIRHWRMDVGFLEMFPEFYDDVTPAEKICPQLELPCLPSYWDTEPWEGRWEEKEKQTSARSSRELNWHMNHDLVAV